MEYGLGKCFCCGFTQISQSNFHCGHIESENTGGELVLENLRPICGGCNSSMNDANMIKFMDGQGIPRIPLDTPVINRINTFVNDMITDFSIYYRDRCSDHDATSDATSNQNRVDSPKSNPTSPDIESAVSSKSATTPKLCNNSKSHKKTKKNEPPYTCRGCDKEFYYKNDHRRHINRKFPCKKEPPDIDEVSDPPKNLTSKTKDDVVTHTSERFECNDCRRTFTRQDNLARHRDKHCRGSLKSKEKVDIQIELDVPIDITPKPDNEQSKPKIIDPMIIVALNNASNDNIKVNAFGGESLADMFSDERVVEYLKRGPQSICELLTDIHFDPKKPERHNIFISDRNRTYINAYNGEQWNSLDKNTIVDGLFTKISGYLNDMFKKLIDRLTPDEIDQYTEFMYSTDAKVIEDIKRDIKQVLYNKRHVPKSTRKNAGL